MIENREKARVLTEVSGFLQRNTKSNIILMTTQSYVSESNVPENLSRKFDLIIMDNQKKILMALDIETSDNPDDIYDEKGFEHVLPFAYVRVNLNLYFNSLNHSKLPYEITSGKLHFLAELLKEKFPQLKTELDLEVDNLYQKLQDKSEENLESHKLIDNLKVEIDKLKKELEYRKLVNNREKIERDVAKYVKKQKKKQKKYFDNCKVLDLLLLAREKLELPLRKSNESSMALSNGTSYSIERSSTNDAFDFYLRYEFDLWILKVSFLGSNEHFGNAILENDVKYYWFDSSKIEFNPLTGDQIGRVAIKSVWNFWEKLLNHEDGKVIK